MKTRPLIIAHRGESYDAPENTLAAVNLAWHRNADAVEVDIHLTGDDNIVVIHDSNTKRTGNISREIRKSTFDELKHVSVGIEKYPDEKIPSLSEVLDTVPSNKKILIELKSGKEIIPRLCKDVGNANLKDDQIEFIGFDFRTMINVKKAFPNHNTYWILELESFWRFKIFQPSVDRIISKVKENNLNGLNLHAGKIINSELIKKIKSAGLTVYLWTVNNPDKAKSYIEMGVDGITTDRAGWMKEKLEL